MMDYKNIKSSEVRYRNRIGKWYHGRFITTDGKTYTHNDINNHVDEIKNEKYKSYDIKKKKSKPKPNPEIE